MRSKGFERMVCSIVSAMAAIGDQWCLLILRDLVLGLSRNEDLRQSSGVTNTTLSDRLKHLEANASSSGRAIKLSGAVRICSDFHGLASRPRDDIAFPDRGQLGCACRALSG